MNRYPRHSIFVESIIALGMTLLASFILIGLLDTAEAPTSLPTVEAGAAQPAGEVACINGRWCNMPIDLPGTYEENRDVILQMLADYEENLSCGQVEDFQVIINDISYGDMTHKDFRWRVTDIILLVDRSDCISD